MLNFFNRIISQALLTSSLLLTPLLLFTISACSERENLAETPFILDEDSANSFLTYLNPQQQFSYDQYQLLILPQKNSSDRTDVSYQVSLLYPEIYSANKQLLEEERDELFTPQWNETVGIDWQSHNETLIELDLTEGREVDVQVDCPETCQLYVLKSGYLYQTYTSAELDGSNAINVSLNTKLTSSLEYAQAYYKVVDPNDERTTLSAWKTKNGFDQGFDVHVIFRDSKDLGYGRDMYGRKNADGSLAFYVNNFCLLYTSPSPRDS